VASVIGSGSDSIRTSILLLVVCRWIQGGDKGVGLGNFADADVATARPCCGAWPHLCAAPLLVYDTSIDGASLVEC